MAGALAISLVVLVVAWVLGGLWLRRANPAVWWRLVGVAWTWMRIYRTWQAVCLELGWTGQRRAGRVAVGGLIVQGREMRPRLPRLWVSVRKGVISVRVRMLPGQVPKAYRQNEALAHAWRVYAVTVTSPERGYVRMVVQPFDSLTAGVEYAEDDTPLAPAPAIGTRRMVSLLVALGIRDSGRAWVVDFRLVPHGLIVGATLSGKSTLLRALMSRLAELPVAIIGIDLKGGLELGLYAPRLSALATTKAGASGVFTQVLALLAEREALCRRAGVVAVWDLEEPPPPVFVIVDELAELFLGDRSDKELRESVTTDQQRIAQKGAFADIHLIETGQRVGSELGPGLTLLRSQLAWRVTLRVADRESAEMSLGDLFPEAVLMALSIPADQQGTAVTAEDGGGWGRVRSARVSVEKARATAQRYAFLRVVLPGLEPPADVNDETQQEA